MINVLVFPCGSEIGLEIHNALKFDKHISLYGLNSVPSHGSMVYKNYIEGISFIREEGFIEELNAIIDQYNIDIIIPAYDDVILYLSEIREKINCKIAISSRRTCDICRSKIKTYEVLKDDFFVPKTYAFDQIREEQLPLFAKPDIGQGSQGVQCLKTMNDVDNLSMNEQSYVISELLPGKEYTVDCFTDSFGNLLIASMRERRRVRTGISVNSITVALSEEVRQIAERINEVIEFNGVWFFQVKQDAKGHFKLLEIAPRVSGSMSTSRIRGFNYVLNTIYQLMGYSIKAMPHLIEQVEVDRALSNKYCLNLQYDYVYIDFDDTITYHDGINVQVISFLYQCLNEKKKVILLTRHAKELEDSFKYYHIDKGLFYDIIHLKEDELKSKYISCKNSIFIDDSFRERFDVSAKCEIPVFDIDAIEALLNWRY